MCNNALLLAVDLSNEIFEGVPICYFRIVFNSTQEVPGLVPMQFLR